jgi:hypothetical protein
VGRAAAGRAAWHSDGSTRPDVARALAQLSAEVGRAAEKSRWRGEFERLLGEWRGRQRGLSAGAPTTIFGPLTSVCVVVPVYNMESSVGRALGGIQAALSQLRTSQSGHGVRAKVVVVDDSSTDDSLATATAHAKRYNGDDDATPPSRGGSRLYEVIRTPVNQGAAAARNLGVRHAMAAATPRGDGDGCGLIVFADVSAMHWTPPCAWVQAPRLVMWFQRRPA